MVTSIVATDENGSTWWRQMEPQMLAAANGYETYVAVFGQPLKHRPHVLIFRGVFFEQTQWEKLVQSCTRDRVMVVVDYDDCYHRLHLDFPEDTIPLSDGRVSAKKAGNSIVRYNCLSNAKAAHLITTTTDYLKGEIARNCGRDDVVVIPNAINLTSWQYLRPPDPERPVLMVMGGTSHIEDWEIIPQIIERLAPVFPSLRFRIAATQPPWVDGLRDWLGDRLETTTWRRHEEYPRIYDGATVCIAPLRDTIFNRCRTPIKFWEATAAGAGFVGSPILYDGDVQDGINGYLAENVDQYVERISYLLSNPERRERMVSLARQTVRDHQLDQEAIEQRWAVYWHRYHALYGSEATNGASPIQDVSEAAARFTERLWTPGGGRRRDDLGPRHGAVLPPDLPENVGRRGLPRLVVAEPNGHGARGCAKR